LIARITRFIPHRLNTHAHLVGYVEHLRFPTHHGYDIAICTALRVPVYLLPIEPTLVGTVYSRSHIIYRFGYPVGLRCRLIDLPHARFVRAVLALPFPTLHLHFVGYLITQLFGCYTHTILRFCSCCPPPLDSHCPHTHLHYVVRLATVVRTVYTFTLRTLLDAQHCYHVLHTHPSLHSQLPFTVV